MQFFNRFNRQNEEIVGAAWSLFQEMHQNPHSQPIGHVIEIMSSVMSGTLDPLQENFNLYGYDVRCSQNDRISEKKNAKKFKPLVSSEEKEDPKNAGGVSIDNDTRTSKIELAYESVSKDMILQDGIKRITKYRTDWIVDQGVDIIVAIVSALEGDQEAVTALQEICSRSEVVSEVVRDILESSENGRAKTLLKSELEASEIG